jgi:hypothetical protein
MKGYSAYDIIWASLLMFSIPLLFASDITFRSGKVRDYYSSRQKGQVATSDK